MKRVKETECSVYSVEELQSVLGICRGAAYKLAKSDGSPFVRVGKSYRIPKSAVALFLETGQWRKDEKST